MKIYTRTGDKGTTGLYGGRRVSKDDIRVEAYGAVDELQSFLGLVIVEIENPCVPTKARSHVMILKDELRNIQGDLFEIAFSLANPRAKPLTKLKKRVEVFERLIDRLTKQLPELRNFVFPGGGWGGAFLHIARSTARRAERRIVTLSQEETVDGGIIKYMNRLSDFLFTMARYVNFQEKKKEEIWRR